IFVEGEYWNAVSDAPIEKGQVAEISAVQGLTVKLKAKGEQSDAITRRGAEINWLGHTPHRSRRHYPAAGHPDSARIRARRDFSARKITRLERAGSDFSHPDCRSNGANGFARRHHQRREAGGNDA